MGRLHFQAVESQRQAYFELEHVSRVPSSQPLGPDKNDWFSSVGLGHNGFTSGPTTMTVLLTLEWALAQASPQQCGGAQPIVSQTLTATRARGEKALPVWTGGRRVRTQGPASHVAVGCWSQTLELTAFSFLLL